MLDNIYNYTRTRYTHTHTHTHTPHTLQALWGGGDGQQIRFFGDSFCLCKVGGQLRQETSIIQTPTSSFVAVVNHLSRRRPWMQMMTIRIGQLIPTIDRYRPLTCATFGWNYSSYLIFKEIYFFIFQLKSPIYVRRWWQSDKKDVIDVRRLTGDGDVVEGYSAAICFPFGEVILWYIYIRNSGNDVKYCWAGNNFRSWLTQSLVPSKRARKCFFFSTHLKMH